MEPRSSNLWRYLVLGLLFSLAASFEVRHTGEVLGDLLDPDRNSRRPFVLGDPWPTVRFVQPEAAQAGIRRGDKVVAIDGEENRGRSLLARAIERRHSGQSFVVTIERDGKRFESGPVQMTSGYETTNPVLRWTVNLLLYLIVPIICVTLGFWSAFIRPRDPMAWLLLALLLSFTHLTGGDVRLEGWEPFWARVAGTAYRTICLGGWPIWMLLFGLYFPKPLQLELLRPWLKWILIAPLAASAMMDSYVSVRSLEDWRGVEGMIAATRALGRWRMVMVFLSVGAFFASLSRKWASASQPDVRRRLRLLVTGTSLGMAPMAVIMLVSIIRNMPIFRVPQTVLVPAVAMLALFPITITYVIVVHRALDVRVVIRQGMQYALARGGLKLVTIALTAVVILIVSTLAMEEGQRRAEIVATVALGFAAVLLLQRVSRRLAGWIDRRFFRASYDAEKVLSELSESVRTMVETKPLLETVAQRVSETLHVPQVAMMLSGNGVYRPAYALGYGEVPEVEIPADSRLATSLGASKGPVRLYLDDEESWARTANLSDEEIEKLKRLDTQVLLPLSVKDRLLGFISLGPKRSEEAYSRTDLRLLNSVAAQTGLALENSHLTEEVARQAAQRERYLREIEIAREVQERLFPQKLPAVEGLDYAGHCRPATAVGGDYYDFLMVGDRFGIAIGDVSGKGISAALLMASLQAALRSQAASAPRSLADLIGSLNRLIFETTPSNRYATFLYAQFDPATGRMAYVNAGHNSPMVLRGREILRLEEGGPPVGLFGPATYEEGSVTLQPGDIVVMFTDGVSEAVNPDDQEWGEDRLAETVLANRECKAADILPAVMEAADAFADGAPQHDDMTLLVLKAL